MESLDELVTATQGLSGRRDDLSHLQGLLHSKGADILARTPQPDLERVLAVLDPAAHSLAWLYVLDALSALLMLNIPKAAVSSPRAIPISNSASASADQVVSSITSFIVLCNGPQIRMDPAKFAGLCRRVKDALMALGAEQHAMRGLLPLRKALEKLQPTPEHLTPVHVDFLQLCLLARCHALGYHLLSHKSEEGEESEQLICEIDPQETSITQTDFLLFCYYGGMVCVGMKKLEQGLRMFLHAITAPAVGLSAITVASYKKYVLLTLILHGKMPSSLPRFIPSVVLRQVKAHCQEYSEIADSYMSRDPKALQAVITKHQDGLSRDGNLGLAKQVVESVFKRSILRLTQTFLTLSLHDIAESVKLPTAKDAESYILRMIESGEIHASISQKDGMVSFLEDPERFNTHRMARQLNAHITRTVELNRKLEEMENSIACDRLYLHRMHMREKTGRFIDPEEIEFGGPSRMFDSM